MAALVPVFDEVPFERTAVYRRSLALPVSRCVTPTHHRGAYDGAYEEILKLLDFRLTH